MRIASLANANDAVTRCCGDALTRRCASMPFLAFQIKIK